MPVFFTIPHSKEVVPAKEILNNPPSHLMSDFVLVGKPNCGKTTTLLHLIALLCGNGALLPAIQHELERTFVYSSTGKPKDAHVVLTYQPIDHSPITIYVSTNGDNWEIVTNNFLFFYQRCKHLTIYHFTGGKFIRISSSQLRKLPRPDVCISPASFNGGAIQAQHYYLGLTYKDWWQQMWVKKVGDTKGSLGMSLPGYTIPTPTSTPFKLIHHEIAKKILDEINRMAYISWP